MINLINKKKESIGLRLKSIRERLGVDHKTLAEACKISPGTLITIEMGKKGYVIDSLLSVTYFLGIELEEISGANFKIQSKQEILQHINQFHQSHKSKAYLRFKNIKQRISNVIQEELMLTDFFSKPREVKEIIEFCRTEYEVTFRSSSVTNAMTKFAARGLIKIISSDRRGVNLYKKIK